MGIFNILRLNSISHPVILEELRELKKVDAKIIEIQGDSREEIIKLAKKVDAVITVYSKLDKEIVSSLQKCRIISRYGIGTDNIDVKEATKSGVLVSNVPDFCIGEMADHTIAMLLALNRKLLPMNEFMRSGNWIKSHSEKMYRLENKILGLLGFGNIARAVAKRAKSFGLKLISHDPYISNTIAEKYKVRLVSFEEIISESDFLIVLIPLNKANYRLIGEKELRKMKNNSVLINTSRGEIIDETALVKALTNNWISAAAVDVYEHLNVFKKPDELPPKSPFFRLRNLICTPHVGALSEEANKEVKIKGSREVVRVLKGYWPKNCINSNVNPKYKLKNHSRSK